MVAWSHAVRQSIMAVVALEMDAVHLMAERRQEVEGRDNV
jgi:hypothetical protein